MPKLYFLIPILTFFTFQLFGQERNPQSKTFSRITAMLENAYHIGLCVNNNQQNLHKDLFPPNTIVHISQKSLYLNDSVYRYDWSVETSQYELTRKEFNTFDENGTPTQSITYDWQPENEVWTKMFKSIHSHDEHGNITQEIRYHWSETEMDWRNRTKTVFTYNSDDYLTKLIGYNWNPNENAFIKNYKYANSYENNQLTERVHSNWDTDTDQWVYNLRQAFIYDEYWEIHLRSMTYNWDNEMNEWSLSAKTENTFDNGNWIKGVTYNWQDEIEGWVAAFKTETDYDNHSNPIKQVWYQWIDDLDNWMQTFKYEQEYDENSNRILFKTFSWDEEANAWQNQTKYQYYFSSLVTTSGESFHTETLTLFPNPASNIVTLKGVNTQDGISVYNTNGKLLLHKKARQANEVIDISHLPKGVYLVAVSNGDKRTVIRLLKL